MSPDEYLLIAKSIERVEKNLREDLKELRDQVIGAGKEIATLKTKASLWGAVSGLIISLVVAYLVKTI